MIERSVNPTKFSPTHSTEYIWSTKYNKIDLQQQLNSLYNSTSQKDRSIYGIQLYEQNASDINNHTNDNGNNNNTNSNNNSKNNSNNNSNNGQLIKCQLQPKHKNYITWCYLLLNWQRVSIQNFDIFHRCLPTSQSCVQQIRVQSNLLKLTKNTKSLTLNLSTHTLQIQPQIRYLDTYDRTGTNPMLQYKLSLCKMWIYDIGYAFDGLVVNVESCEGFAAVATKNSVYVVFLKEINGNSVRFQVQNCIDMKWSKRGLYYLQKSGHIGLLQRQTTYLPTMNKFTNITILPTTQSHQSSSQYKSQRIALTGINQLSNSLILLSVSDKNRKKILLQIIYNNKYGIMRGAKLKYQLREISGDVMYCNLVNVNKNQLTLVAVSGFQGRVQCYHQYKFGTI